MRESDRARSRQFRVALRDWRTGWGQRWRPHSETLEELRNPGAEPVFLLPGVWEKWQALWSWGLSLAEVGYDINFVPELDGQFGDLDALAQRLLEAIGDTSPIVVGHSKGGLVAQKALQLAPDSLWGVIAVASPFRGAPLARLALPGLRMFDLRPGTEQIDILTEDTRLNHKLITIEAQWDQNVPRVGLIRGSLHQTVPVVGHNALLTAPAAQEAIVQAARHISNSWQRPRPIV